MPSSAGAVINVTVKLQGKLQSIAVAPTSPVSKLRDVLAEKEGVQPGTVRVSFGGKELDEAMTLEDAKVGDGAALFLVQRIKPRNYTVTIKTLKDKVFSITKVDEATSVLELKRRVEEQDPQWEVTRQRIIYQGRELADEDLISQCGLDDANPSVHLVMRLPAPGCARKRKEESSRAKPVATRARADEDSVFSVKSEPLEEIDYKDDAGHLGLDDVLGDCSNTPMEFDTAWQEFNEEPALQSTGWDSSMEMLTSPRTTTSSIPITSPMDAVMAVPVNDSPVASSASSSYSPPPPKDYKAEKQAEPTACPSTQGRAYDLTKVDDKLRKRLLKNRLSAERSRQRKQAHVETLEFELSCCRSENEALKKRVACLEAQLASLSLGNQGMALRPQIAVT
mmetsp:Transcript_2368/g.5657  ORF Transcript_2368/g.5657 Transcript_2368/m.5657 type:complete len:394 (+) Transcript_2368:32-1213(+)